MTDIPQGLFLLCYPQSLCVNTTVCASLREDTAETNSQNPCCGFEACLDGEGSVCLLLLPKSCVVTCLFDSLLRTDTLLRGDAEQTLEVSNLSRRQRARVQGKILTTTLASASSSCFLSQPLLDDREGLSDSATHGRRSQMKCELLGSCSPQPHTPAPASHAVVLEGKWLPLLVVDL